MEHRNVAIILSGGSGKRMNSSIAKQYMLLEGKPVIYYTMQAFEQSALIDEIILVVGKGDIEFVTTDIINQYDFTKVKIIVEGGAERYESVWKGLQAWKERDLINKDPMLSNTIWIHDGARPLIDEASLQRLAQAVQAYQACVAGMPVKDTIKIADENGFVAQTPSRDRVWMIQTPQVFDARLIYESYEKLMERLPYLLKGISITDDASVVELMTDHSVRLVEASYENLKITTPEDLLLAANLVKFRTDVR